MRWAAMLGSRKRIHRVAKGPPPMAKRLRAIVRRTRFICLQAATILDF
jgi:hypothetical protein